MNTKSVLLSLALALGVSSVTYAAGVDYQQQLLENLGAWVSLAITITAFLIALMINLRSNTIRAIGTLFSSFACFALVIWFVTMLQTGILENPRPNQTPMDSAKPLLLYLQVAVAFIAGTILLARAVRVLNDKDQLELSLQNDTKQYGLISRVLHWMTAILILSLFPLGIFATIIPDQFWFRNDYYIIHKTIGLTVIALVTIRVLWNRHSRRPEPDEALKPNERKWAHRAHIALYVMMLAIPITGYVMTSYHGYPAFFYFWELQPLWAESKAYIVWGLIHKYVFQYVLYIILGAHIIGALKHHWIDKHDKALKRMIG